jgi:DNA-binding transcriptional regulator LsrR (DeoR family)
VSGGPYKADIIRAVLLRKLVHELVIDEATAERLVGRPVTGKPRLEKRVT